MRHIKYSTLAEINEAGVKNCLVQAAKFDK
jgi:hypothetical protein